MASTSGDEGATKLQPIKRRLKSSFKAKRPQCEASLPAANIAPDLAAILAAKCKIADGPASQSTTGAVAGGPCGAYRLDMSAKQFGDCVSGFSKSDCQKAQVTQWSSHA
jgi:hypothetical protein